MHKSSNKPSSRAALEKIASDFRVLSEPMRLAILQELKAGGRTVGELCLALSASQPNVSKHLRVLFDARFVSRRPEGNHVRYAISDGMVLRLCNLVCDRLNRQAQESVPHYSI